MAIADHSQPMDDEALRDWASREAWAVVQTYDDGERLMLPSDKTWMHDLVSGAIQAAYRAGQVARQPCPPAPRS